MVLERKQADNISYPPRCIFFHPCAHGGIFSIVTSTPTQHALELKRPLAFFDLETTGINTQSDRIVEIAVLKYLPNRTTRSFEHRINPTILIPEQATAVHGITDADVALAPTFQQLATRLIEFLDNCDLSGFNLRRFDLPLLLQEFQRCGEKFLLEGRHIIDVQTIFHSREPRDLSAALQFYCAREHSGAHGAMADVQATADVLFAQLERYEDLPHTIAELESVVHPKDPSWLDEEGKLVRDGNNVIITFGKHRGTSLSKIIERDRDYIQWILDGNFHPSTKAVIRKALEEYTPDRPLS
ncbi:MAG: DNA polymerase III subunit epsilon [Ignavibacteria bacterium]|nr:MAG: DNA polymerase III subunit epsilon [Ignavibacteria bacterium]